MKSVHVDCPTYLELEIKNGKVNAVNGKELSETGVEHVISFLGEEVGVKTDDVLEKVRSLNKNNGCITLKMYEGTVNAM